LETVIISRKRFNRLAKEKSIAYGTSQLKTFPTRQFQHGSKHKGQMQIKPVIERLFLALLHDKTSYSDDEC
jgi:hypothetical protein